MKLVGTFTVLLIALATCHCRDTNMFTGMVTTNAASSTTTKPVALESVSVKADVRGLTVGVIAELTYRNTFKNPIETQFVFPLSDTAAVYKLEATFSKGRIVVAQVQARDQAEQIYKAARDAGKRAVLLENQKGVTDVYRILFGNLMPNETTKVTIGYAEPLERDPDTGVISYLLPVVLNPRHNPNPGDDPSVFPVQYVAVSQVSYKLNFKASIDMGVGGSILDITTGNNNDLIKVKYPEQPDKTVAEVTLRAFTPDHDFRLLIKTERTMNTLFIVESGVREATPAIQPRQWRSYQIGGAWYGPESEQTSAVSNDEYWVLVDQSRSMEQGGKIRAARNALKGFIQGLPLGCKFNIITFSNSYDVLFQTGAVDYNAANKAKALNFTDKFALYPDGGTDILTPLRYIYSKPTRPIPNSKRYIFLLTDGEVTNTDDVITAVQNNAATSVVFSIGIGEGASTSLVNGVARVSNGLSDMLPNAKVNDLQAKLVRFLQATLTAGDNLNIMFSASGGEVVNKTPNALPSPVFRGRTVKQFALFERRRPPTLRYSAHVEMSAKTKGKSSNIGLSTDLANQAALRADDSMPLHNLAAKSRLTDLVDEYRKTRSNATKQEAVELSKSTGVLCEFTAYVAVDVSRVVNPNGSPVPVNIFIPSNYDWATGTSTGPAKDGVFGSRSSTSKTAFSIAGLQDVDGSIPINDDLVDEIGSSNAVDMAGLNATVRAAVPAISDADDAVCGTLAGLAVLRNRFATTHSDWQSIETKAVVYLLSKGIKQADIDMYVSDVDRALQSSTE